jgi:protein disulfide-isomerase
MKRYSFFIFMLSVSLMWGCSEGEDKKVQNKVKQIEWLSDFDRARAMAEEEGVPILINFSGSDWCGWCMRLEDEVFTQQPFLDFAEESLILFVADFPRQKQLPEKTAIQNQNLARKFGIRGLPTILLVNAEGEEIARTGYQRGGAETYVRHLKTLINQAESAD